MALLPVLAFGAKKTDDLLFIADSSKPLLHIAFDDDEFSEAESELSLLEIDEQDASLLPWDLDELDSEELSSVMQSRAAEIADEYEDVFAFDLPSPTSELEPSYEKVKKKPQSYAKPRVVTSNP
jgi:hypothetical protein